MQRIIVNERPEDPNDPPAGPLSESLSPGREPKTLIADRSFSPSGKLPFGLGEKIKGNQGVWGAVDAGSTSADN